MAGRRAVSPTIYIGRPDLLDLGHEVAHEEIGKTLSAAAKTATEITILGGFYSVDPLISLCRRVPSKRRGNCRVRIAVGLDATSSIPKTWDDMRRLRSALIELRFVNPVVSIVDSKPVHFHAKLFRFLHTTQPVWFVGSANPGSTRHELMVKISGRHDALSAYVKAVFAKAVEVNRPKPKGRITSLREFFMSGVLCHKPPIHQLFTFNAFEINPDHREQLTAALAGSSGVSHASPETKGFGFNLRSALPPDMRADPFATGAGPSRIPLKPYSIDTVFGRWIPDAYATRLRRKVKREEALRAQRLMRIGQALASEGGCAAVYNAFDDHIASMGVFLKKHSIEARPVSNREARFEKFLSAKIRSLTNRDTVERYGRSLMMTDMPDIWGDGSAVVDFLESFFDDLAFRAAGLVRPAIVKSLLAWLNDDTVSAAEDFRKEMETRLTTHPWEDGDWLLA